MKIYKKFYNFVYYAQYNFLEFCLKNVKLSIGNFQISQWFQYDHYHHLDNIGTRTIRTRLPAVRGLAKVLVTPCYSHQVSHTLMTINVMTKGVNDICNTFEDLFGKCPWCQYQYTSDKITSVYWIIPQIASGFQKQNFSCLSKELASSIISFYT